MNNEDLLYILQWNTTCSEPECTELLIYTTSQIHNEHAECRQSGENEYVYDDSVCGKFLRVQTNL